MTNNLPVIIAVVVISLIMILLFAGRISSFIEKNPSLQMLALSFLILIGTVLIADGAGFHVPKGYIYFAVAFSLIVETLNLQLRKKSKPKGDNT